LKLSLIIPSYNEEQALLTIIKKVTGIPFNKEIIIVDDVFIDSTPRIFSNHKDKRDIKIVRHNSNQGKEMAILEDSKRRKDHMDRWNHRPLGLVNIPFFE
jgi:glycosyltransferase involved in cell wall biosynthesis